MIWKFCCTSAGDKPIDAHPGWALDRTVGLGESARERGAGR
jgi:hypothetical protein